MNKLTHWLLSSYFCPQSPPAGDYRNDDHSCVHPSVTNLVVKITTLSLHRESPNWYQRCISGRPRSSSKTSELDLLSRSQCYILFTTLEPPQKKWECQFIQFQIGGSNQINLHLNLPISQQLYYIPKLYQYQWKEENKTFWWFQIISIPANLCVLNIWTWYLKLKV